jgi:prepilin-type N-terminal cleavage/methylation domain-containing protein
MLIKQREAKGFTLVEVLVVVVILAILAAIAVPIYLSYVEGARASEAQEAIGNIWAAAKIHQAKTGQWPSDVTQIQNLNLDQIVKDRWRFTIDGGGSRIRRITGTSTARMPGGGGRTVIFNAETGTWSGYGS